MKKFGLVLIFSFLRINRHSFLMVFLRFIKLLHKEFLILLSHFFSFQPFWPELLLIFFNFAYLFLPPTWSYFLFFALSELTFSKPNRFSPFWLRSKLLTLSSNFLYFAFSVDFGHLILGFVSLIESRLCIAIVWVLLWLGSWETLLSVSRAICPRSLVPHNFLDTFLWCILSLNK